MTTTKTESGWRYWITDSVFFDYIAELGIATIVVPPAAGIISAYGLIASDFVLFVETLFLLPGRHIGGNLVILLGSSEMGAVLKGIDRVF